MKNPLKVGIAGYGVVGQRRHRFIDLHDQLQTVAVSDIKLKDGVSNEGVKTHSDYTKLLEEDLDLLFVSLPNYLAPEVTIAGLKRGMHVFCEKPPGRDVEDVARVRDVARENPSLKLKYGFNHRYHESFKEALRIIDTGTLGRVINLRGVYGKSKIINFDSEWRTQRAQAGGGILLDQGIHMLDMMRTIAGSFSEVHSVVSNDYWNHDVEDNAYALMKAKDRVVASIHSSATQWRHTFRLEIGLSDGLIVLSGILSGSQSYGDEEIIVFEKKSEDVLEKRTFEFTEDNSWRDEIADFYDAVASGRPVMVGSVDEAYETMKLVYQIYCADKDWAARYDLRSPT
jgi:predicted dehydrogenase